MNIFIEKLKGKLIYYLRKTEKYIETDMVYLFHGSFWLVVGQIFSSFSSFILVIAFANLLPKETYGIYKYVLTIVGVLCIPNLRNMNISIAQSVAQGNEGTAIEGIKTKIKWGLLGGLGAIILGCYYFYNDNHVLGIMLMICASFIPLKDSFGAYGSILNGKKDFRRITIYSTVPTIISTLLTIIILFATHNIYYVLFFYFSFWTIINYILLKITLKIHPLNKIVDPKSIKYGKDVSFMAIVSNVSGYFDKLLIFHYLGAGSIASYSIAMAPISQITSLLGGINTLALPKFSKHTTENLKYSLKNKEKKIVIMTLTLAILYILLAKPLFIIFLPKYLEAIFYSQLLAISIPLTLISRFRLTAIQSRFDIKNFYYYTSFTSVLQILLNFIGVYFYGLLGIVISDIAIAAGQCLITGIIIKKL